MAIVSRGLGQPEAGAIVTAGLGVSETDPNALHAHIYGTSSVLADLTGTGGNELAATLTGTSTLTAELTAETVVSPGGGGGGGGRSWPIPLKRPRPELRPAPLAAHLYGAATLTAELTFTVDFDAIDIELLLLVDAI